MTCKDCAHYEVCKIEPKLVGFNANGKIRECDHFKDKSKFIELPCKVTARNEWISVKDRLPEDEDSLVLAVANGKYKNVQLINAVMLAEYNHKEGWILELYPEWETPDVTYWMPLPEPPEE